MISPKTNVKIIILYFLSVMPASSRSFCIVLCENLKYLPTELVSHLLTRGESFLYGALAPRIFHGALFRFLCRRNRGVLGVSPNKANELFIARLRQMENKLKICIYICDTCEPTRVYHARVTTGKKNRLAHAVLDRRPFQWYNGNRIFSSDFTERHSFRQWK